MRFTRTVCAALVAAGIVSLSLATSAMAAAPTNDMIGGATAAALGFSQSLDTTEATTDAVDAEANMNCGAPATDASVWYSYTADADGGVIVDVSASNYTAGVIVVSGSPGAFNIETCGPGTVAFNATAGTTYYVLAFDDQYDGGGNGGNLAISFSETPPPPTIDVKVDKAGYVNKDGSATVTGKITCTDASFADVFTTMQQTIGTSTVTGFGDFFGAGTVCTGDPQPWSSQIIPRSGVFVKGKAASFTQAFACGLFTCADGYTFQTVKLQAAPKK